LLSKTGGGRTTGSRGPDSKGAKGERVHKNIGPVGQEKGGSRTQGGYPIEIQNLSKGDDRLRK